MTDELYGCGNCGIQDGETYTKYQIQGFPNQINEDQLEEICELLDIEMKDIEVDEIGYCSNCREEYDGIFISSSENC